MSHNNPSQEIEFFLLFLHSTISGERKYTGFILPVLEDARELATGKPAYQLNNASLGLKIMIGQLAHDWLLNVDVKNPTTPQLQELQSIITENRNQTTV